MTDKVLGGRYRIVRHVAKGGMAQVYLAHDQLLDRAVAVKVLVPELAHDPSFVERFRREAQAAAGLNHHNIVSVYDFGQDDGAHFIVMEYVDGPTLRDVVRGEGPLAPEKVIEIGAEVAAGLAAAHQQGIIHRDMKPANVLVAQSGNVKVADFGIARAAHSAREGLTMPGAVVGTATYLSPEQALGNPVDQRSDLYSLGMMLYEMLAGRPPFTGESPVAVAYKQVNDTPPPPSVYNPLVPPALDAIIMRAMAKDPADRQQSAESFRAELLAVQFGVSEPEPTMASAGQMAGAPGATGAESVVAGVAGGAGVAAAATAAGAEPTDPGVRAGKMVEATPTTVNAGPATAMMPPMTAVDGVAAGGGGMPPVRPPVGRPARGPAPYRRRQATVLAVVLVAAVALIALVAALTSGGGGDTPTTVTVPAVVGFDINDAVAAIDRVGLKPDIQVDDKLAGPTDKVAEQDPPGGATAKTGDKVALKLPVGSSDTVVTTEPPSTDAPATTEATTATTRAPATTVPATTPATPAPTTPPTTSPPTTSPPVATTIVVATTLPGP